MILAATAASGSVTIPLGMLLTILGFTLTAATSFAVYLVKQIAALNRSQAEFAIIMKQIADRAIEDRARIAVLEGRVRTT
jgi:hypothetical protein